MRLIFLSVDHFWRRDTEMRQNNQGSRCQLNRKSRSNLRRSKILALAAISSVGFWATNRAVADTTAGYSGGSYAQNFDSVIGAATNNFAPLATTSNPQDLSAANAWAGGAI